ncbi:MAG TPA: alpha/beta fold hydrolase, partial [Rubrobacteraceae bacterium]
RSALGLEQIHLLGHSWGGWLAIEYMLSGARGVLGLVLASTSASISQFVAEAERLKAALPPGVSTRPCGATRMPMSFTIPNTRRP